MDSPTQQNSSAAQSAKTGAQPPRLLDQVRSKLRLLHYSKRTEEAYVDWIRRFILYHNKKHPKDMGANEVESYLTHLAVEANVAASTQNQALAAILFLYQKVLEIELPRLDAVRAKRPQRLPVVLSVEEVRLVLDRMTETYRLMADLMYGSGLRLLDCCRLRVKDIDFARGQIVVREAGRVRQAYSRRRTALAPRYSIAVSSRSRNSSGPCSTQPQLAG